MNGFVSPDNDVGSLNVWQFRISPSGEVVELDPSSIHWTEPAAYPAVGQPATFMMDANITTICTAECHPATGTFHLEGPFAFQWIVSRSNRVRWIYVIKQWTNTDKAAVTLVTQ